MPTLFFSHKTLQHFQIDPILSHTIIQQCQWTCSSNGSVGFQPRLESRHCTCIWPKSYMPFFNFFFFIVSSCVRMIQLSSCNLQQLHMWLPKLTPTNSNVGSISTWEMNLASSRSPRSILSFISWTKKRLRVCLLHYNTHELNVHIILYYK